ncbi:hypothetical protein HMP0015_1999 [Acinetobacter haemolyticus ATCC 19194]|uniref:Uncharacterized protein n=1 Tax=Acinetobacter haemolyticus ATCC 19194 TaxID=707232 RepID=D4XQK7_ACIHA|nr:hypothetical protein HMP0015_1999 [Acinetobacter haemolyticus ATCC 19194]
MFSSKASEINTSALILTDRSAYKIKMPCFKPKKYDEIEKSYY